MFNEAHISLSGYVATQPFYKETRTGIPSLTMRVAWTPRWMDRVTGEWTDADTSFLRVNCYRKLAENAATCVRKGDPVVVRGRVSVRNFEDKNGMQRTVVEVDAHSVGHDLSRGVTQFQRVRPHTGMTAMEFKEAEDSLGGEGAGRSDDADEATFASMAAAAAEGGRDGALGSAGSLGSSGADEAGEPGGRNREADVAGAARPDGANGSDDEMFDEAAVSMLAQEAASVAAPF